MRTNHIVGILLDERIFPNGYYNTVDGYYQEIVNFIHINEDSNERKRSKRNLYYILNRWNSANPVLRERRAVCRYPRYNAIARYNPGIRALTHTDIFYRLD